MDTNRKQVMIFGATSAIAQEFARLVAMRDVSLFLVARDEQKLVKFAAELRVASGRSVESKTIDFSSCDQVLAAVQEATKLHGRLDVVLVAQGVLPDQQACQAGAQEAMEAIQTNFLTAVNILTAVANQMEQQRQGSIAVISSVAGDRGRQSNYVYGAAKGGLSVFLQGLRNRLARSNVTVLTVKPGFVETPMTAHLPKGILFAKPRCVAAGILRAIDRRKDVVYLPWFWRWIMLLVRFCPEWIFKRLTL